MYKSFFKRFFDFFIALTAIIFLSPLLLIVTVWLHFANKGAGAFFFQERPGLHEHIFKIIKFKSMTDDCDAAGNLLPDRERLTKVGRIVRSLSIDELPQLFNVLKGDMALIGPRPLLTRYLPFYTEREKLRHTVRPGITGLAQINGRNHITWNDKLEYDAYYAENLSLMLDLKIFFSTIKKVVKKEGVQADKKENYLDLERKSK
ncbi:sugar transferase [Prevotella corporis]|uniref:sugar transferase n=1 Tax=Prevotella corporis TaxID=28128 RepID=UPI0023F64A04|nr:sugar transferase [Prevotella corporis]